MAVSPLISKCGEASAAAAWRRGGGVSSIGVNVAKCLGDAAQMKRSAWRLIEIEKLGVVGAQWRRGNISYGVINSAAALGVGGGKHVSRSIGGSAFQSWRGSLKVMSAARSSAKARELRRSAPSSAAHQRSGAGTAAYRILSIWRRRHQAHQLAGAQAARKSVAGARKHQISGVTYVKLGIARRMACRVRWRSAASAAAWQHRLAHAALSAYLRGGIKITAKAAVGVAYLAASARIRRRNMAASGIKWRIACGAAQWRKRRNGVMNQTRRQQVMKRKTAANEAKLAMPNANQKTAMNLSALAYETWLGVSGSA